VGVRLVMRRRLLVTGAAGMGARCEQSQESLCRGEQYKVGRQPKCGCGAAAFSVDSDAVSIAEELA
jgi:hypothetical protein